MDNIINGISADAKIITPDDGYHYFFAYYDMRATGKRGKHLCHRVKFFDRLPTSEDVAELGYLEDGRFVKFAQTTAWNFQQGAMLQYHPYLDNTVYYNVCENGRFMTVTHDIATGEKKYTDRATACISPDGKWGLGINFGRIFSFRAGYGYAGFKDKGADINAPSDDGVFLVDMESGESRLLVSYDVLAPLSGFTGEDKILINHITFNTDSDRYLMLVRNFPSDTPWGWSTSLVVGDLKGNVHAVLKNTYFSHYNWKNGHEVVAHCTVEGDRKSMYLIDVDSGKYTEYNMPFFDERAAVGRNSDIHCCFSPDGNYIIGDGYYCKADPYRDLLAYSLRTGESRTLLRALDDGADKWGDMRCDLHARFIWDGSHISFDTACNGKRQIALISADVLDF